MPAPFPRDAQARLALGQRLAALRQAAGYTQDTFAPLTFYGRSTIANVETGRQRIGRDFWARCDEVLKTGGCLVAEYDRLKADTLLALTNTTDVRPAPVMPSADAQLPPPTSVGTLSLLEPPHRRELTSPRQPRQQLRLWAPAGCFFPGLAIDAEVHPVTDPRRILAAVPDRYVDDPFLHRPGRRLVIGHLDANERPQLFGLDTRQARRSLRGTAPGARLLIPRAYELDELTFAILWAVANLDEALLHDDALLAESQRGIATYQTMTRCAASRDMAPDLTAAAQMWLGSLFCSSHVLRHTPALTDAPVFWTREMRGEEASTWLLFAHKIEYLQATAARFPDDGAHMVRAFCLPRQAVTDSPRAERVLLLLAVALMESYGIEVVVTDEPEYAGTAGFVSDHRRRVIVANWIRADGIWHVDLTDHRPTVRDYTDTAVHATAHSIIAAPTVQGRLPALAEYLELNWQWLLQRCAELADQGCEGLAQPRSRLLSLAGIDRACRYLASLRPCTN